MAKAPTPEVTKESIEKAVKQLNKLLDEFIKTPEGSVKVGLINNAKVHLSQLERVLLYV